MSIEGGKMFNLKSKLINTFFKFEVLSNIPGRMRIKVNHFKKIPKESFEYQIDAIRAIKKLQGIEEVSFNSTIGTILIEYNTEKLTSEEIISWLNFIKKLLLENIDIINNLEGKPEEYVKNKLFEILDSEMEKDRGGKNDII